jgi:cytochrome c peroxidase
VGTRFQNILVSEFNAAKNPVQDFVFTKNGQEVHVASPDIGRSAITGVLPFPDDSTFSNFNAFKIPQLRGIKDTGPYFHDNSAKTLEDVMKHYANNFFFPFIILTPEDQADIIAFMKLLR